MIKPQIGDTVICKRDSYHSAFPKYGRSHKVKKVYKNGNVILDGFDSQYNVLAGEGGYALVRAGLLHASVDMVLLSDAEKEKMELYNLLESVFNALGEMEKTVSNRKNRGKIRKITADDAIDLMAKTSALGNKLKEALGE